MIPPEESLIGVELRASRYSSILSQPIYHTMDHVARIDLSASSNTRHAKIICTLGPSSHSVDTIKQLMEAGMNIARLNFSHGTHDYHLQSIKNIREAEAQLRSPSAAPIGIALDTKGPEIRTGVLSKELGDKIKLQIDDEVTITTNAKYKDCCDINHLFVTYERITAVIKKGHKIYIDDGFINLVALEDPVGEEIKCKVLNGGKLGNRKGVNLPDCHVDLPAVSDKDKEDLAFGLLHGVDFVFASFIQSAEAIHEIREFLGPHGSNIKIIAKLENQQGIQNLDSIVEAADGIMVARGDLGIEIPPEKVFVAQKMIITRCNFAGKPVICATQMLESMTEHPRATRAEVSDVANAVLDGADCVMLSGETANGLYPVECVKLMDAIARQAETCVFHKERFLTLTQQVPVPLPPDTVAAIAAVEASFKVKASIIIVLTATGNSAALISRFCPNSTIMAVTRILPTARTLSILRACHGIYLVEDEMGALRSNVSSTSLSSKQTKIVQENVNIENWLYDVEKRVNKAVLVAKEKGYVRKGDPMICVTGWRSGAGSTNTIRVMYCD